MPACPLRLKHCIQQWRDVWNCKLSFSCWGSQEATEVYWWGRVVWKDFVQKVVPVGVSKEILPQNFVMGPVGNQLCSGVLRFRAGTERKLGKAVTNIPLAAVPLGFYSPGWLSAPLTYSCRCHLLWSLNFNQAATGSQPLAAATILARFQLAFRPSQGEICFAVAYSNEDHVLWAPRKHTFSNRLSWGFNNKYKLESLWKRCWLPGLKSKAPGSLTGLLVLNREAAGPLEMA